MPKKTQISVASPCHEDWGNMQPDKEGRFCGSCQKTVVDFTTMSDQEILNWLSGAGSSVCGCFMGDQLNRNLAPATMPRKNRWAVWQFLLAGLLISSEVSAQADYAPPTMSQTDSNTSREPMILGGIGRTLPQRPDLARVRIVDSVTGLPISWASVRFGNKKGQLIADKDGEFDISSKLLRRALSLDITAVGYEESEVVADKTWIDGRKRIIEVSRAAQELQNIIVVGYGCTSRRTVTGEVLSTYSETVTIQQMVKDTLTLFGLCKKPFAVYPNPVGRGASVTLSVQTGDKGNYVAQLFSSGGALIASMPIEAVDGPRTELMNIPGTIAAGAYFIRLIHTRTGKMYTQKVVVL
jgi:hypothetical protein